MRTLEKIATRINETGLDRPSRDNITVKLALVLTKLNDAQRACHAHRTCHDSPIDDLADVAIQLLSILDALWPDRWGNRVINRKPKPGTCFESIEVQLWPIVNYVCLGIKSRGNERNMQMCIELALLETFRLAEDTLGYDLVSAVWVKMKESTDA